MDPVGCGGILDLSCDLLKNEPLSNPRLGRLLGAGLRGTKVGSEVTNFSASTLHDRSYSGASASLGFSRFRGPAIWNWINVAKK